MYVYIYIYIYISDQWLGSAWGGPEIISIIISTTMYDYVYRY